MEKIFDFFFKLRANLFHKTDILEIVKLGYVSLKCYQASVNQKCKYSRKKYTRILL